MRAINEEIVPRLAKEGWALDRRVLERIWRGERDDAAVMDGVQRGLAEAEALELRAELSETAICERGFETDIALDAPVAGAAVELYQLAAQRLGFEDASRLVCCAGGVAIDPNSDLSSASLADGSVLTAYVSAPLELPVHVLALPAALAGAEDLPPTFACRSSDSVADVRARIVATAAAQGRGQRHYRSRSSRPKMVHKLWPRGKGAAAEGKLCVASTSNARTISE